MISQAGDPSERLESVDGFEREEDLNWLVC